MASVWRDIVLLTVKETPSKTKEGAGFGAWVIQKLRDGAHYNVTLRAGNYFTNQLTGEREYPKGGLTDYDLNDLKKTVPGTAETYWAAAMRLLDRKNPPPVPAEGAPVGGPPEAPEPEKMPWE